LSVDRLCQCVEGSGGVGHGGGAVAELCPGGAEGSDEGDKGQAAGRGGERKGRAENPGCETGLGRATRAGTRRATPLRLGQEDEKEQKDARDADSDRQ